MLAPSKRRQVSFYVSLPVLVAIVLLAVARLVAMQRAEIIAELSDRVAHRDTQEAAAAVRHLAAMPRPPVAVLVAAACANDRQVADEAQRAISKLLRSWQQQISAEHRAAPVTRQLLSLAEALAEQRDAFRAADHPWLARTTQKIVRLASRIPGERTPLVALHCDMILAVALRAPAAPAQGAAETAVVREPAASRVVAADAGAILQAPRDVAATAVTPIEPSATSEPGQAGGPASDPRTAVNSANELGDAAWHSSWSHPLLRMMPAMPMPTWPIDGAERPSSPALPGPHTEPVKSPLPDHPLAEVDARALLRAWLAAEGNDVHPLEQELTQRGFGRLSERLVEQLFSEAAADRLRLVDDVLTEPGVDARPWLMLLADDASADVRLLAVTIMATSNDGALVEKAWQVAIRDRDPRIAGLAERLRARRDAVRR